MELTQEDLLLVLKSVKDELVNEELEAAKLKAAAESSESSTSTSDSSPVAMKEKAAMESSESSSETSTDEKKPFEKKKSAEDEQVEAVDLYQTYVGLGQENPEDLKNHLIAATMASMAHAGQDMSNAWTAFKSAKEVVVAKSAEEVDQALTQEIAAAKEFAAKVEQQNQQLVEQNTTLEKSLKETNDKVAELSAKFAELAKQPQTAQAASVKPFDNAPKFIVKQSADIVKSLAEHAKSDKCDDKDREIITRYTLRPSMTPELQEFFKKIGSV
jgi:hypothetical protein